jgi:hypothetical protein
MAIYKNTPPIVTNGLVMNLDAGSRMSYPSSGTTWNDLSGNNVNVTLTVSGSGATSASFNLINQGTINFTGSTTFGSYAVNTSPSVLTGSQNFTIGLWINPRAAARAITTMIDFTHGLPSGNNGWAIQSEDATTNRFYYFVYNQTGSTYQPAGNFGTGKGIQITNNVWQNICYVKNGTSVIGYLNGIQRVNYTATSATIAYSSSIQPLWIAGANIAMPPNPPRWVNGDYGNVQYYNRALSAQEVAQNYNALKSRFNLT